MKSLFAEDLNVINVGLQGFADNITAAGGSVTQLSWAPPAGADADLGRTLAGLVGNAVVDDANTLAYGRYLAAQPRLVDLVLAREGRQRIIVITAGIDRSVQGQVPLVLAVALRRDDMDEYLTKHVAARVIETNFDTTVPSSNEEFGHLGVLLHR